MSTLEKTITLLREMPEQSLEALYDFISSVWKSQSNNVKNLEATSCDAPISKGMEGFKILQSFAGTLPADFDYKKELEEMRTEKYERFN